MIQTEMVGSRIRHYSDADMKIRQIETGRLFDDAVDVVPCRFTYEETDVPIESQEADPAEAMDYLFGGEA